MRDIWVTYPHMKRTQQKMEVLRKVYKIGAPENPILRT